MTNAVSRIWPRHPAWVSAEIAGELQAQPLLSG